MKMIDTISINEINYNKWFFCLLFTIAGTCANAQFEELKSHFHTLEKQANKEPVTIQFVHEDLGLFNDLSDLKQIILLRHGEPALNKKGWRNRKEAIKFIKAYDSVGVYPPEHIPLDLIATDVDVIFTSTLNRSISTAEQLFQRPDDQRADPQFREFERRIFGFPNIKLPLKWWLTGSRMFWLMGFNKKGIESFSEAKTRAKAAVVVLEADANGKGKTLLVSHGLLNHYLSKYLQKNGWTLLFDGGKGYMSQKLFIKRTSSR